MLFKSVDPEKEPTWDDYKENGKRDLMGFISRLRRTANKLRGKIENKGNADRLVQELESFVSGDGRPSGDRAAILKGVLGIYKLAHREAQQGKWNSVSVDNDALNAMVALDLLPLTFPASRRIIISFGI